MARSIVVCCALVAVLVAACGSSAGPSPSVDPGQTAVPATSASDGPVNLTIFGAASLKGVLDKVKAVYEATHAGTTLTISTDSSTALETQIEQGAPADVFLSADQANPAKLVDKGLAAGVPVPFAGNRLTIIVPVANTGGIASPADLARTGIKIVAAGDEVPITKYAKQLIDNIAKSAGAPADFAAKVAANTVSYEDNVKAVVAKIELGEGDAAIVYVTDAKASTKVATIAVDPAVNVPATDAGVVVKDSKHPAAAGAFLTWLAGPDGQAILAGFGFLPPS